MAAGHDPDNLPTGDKSKMNFGSTGKAWRDIWSAGHGVGSIADVPTVAEAGVPGYEATSWIGMLAPAGTPPAIIDRLWNGANEAMQTASVRETLAKGGTDIVMSKPDEFREVIASDLAKYAKLADLFKSIK